MKTSVFLVFFTLHTFVAACSLDPGVLEKIHEKCFKISHMPKETLVKMKTGVVDLSDNSVKNHLFCFTKSVGYINEEGILNNDFIKEKLSLQVKDKDKVENDAKVCNAPKTPDEDVNYFAAKVVACYYERSPGLCIV